MTPGVSGVVFEAGNPVALLDEVSRAWSMPGLLPTLGYGARASFDAKYTEQTNHEVLMGVYENAIRQRKNVRLD